MANPAPTDTGIVADTMGTDPPNPCDSPTICIDPPIPFEQPVFLPSISANKP